MPQKRRKNGKPRHRPPKRTSAATIARTLRAQALLNLRLAGASLHQIGQEQKPRISAQRVFTIITEHLSRIASENVEQVRSMEMLRLDELQNAVYPQALEGDIVAIDRVIAIMRRRAMLCGVDLQMERMSLFGGKGESQSQGEATTIRIEVIGNPERDRQKWLEERVRFLEAKDVTPASKNDLQ